MKTPLLSRCLLFVVAMLLAFQARGQSGGSGYYYTMTYPSGPLATFYASSSYVRIQVPLERTGHNFSLKWRTVQGGPFTTGSVYGVGFTTNSQAVNGNAATIGAMLQSFLVVGNPPSSYTYTYNPQTGSYTYTYTPFSAYEWQLVDTTAGQESQIVPGTPGGYNGSQVTYSGVLNGPWTQLPGNSVSNRYFAIADSRMSHSLILWDGNSWTPATAGYYVYGTYASGTSGAVVPLVGVASATWPANSTTAYLADLTTGEKAAPGAMDVRLASAWTMDTAYSIHPLVGTSVTLPAREAGHRFAVHRKASYGPVLSQVYTAEAATPNAWLNFSIGKGLRFWVTREAENGAVNQPVAPVGASAANTVGWVNHTAGSTFSAISPNPNLFPAAPNRPAGVLASRLVRINAGAHPSPRSFSVRLGDGYSTTYDGSAASHVDPVTGATIPPYTSATIQDWNEQGVAQPLPIYTFATDVDSRFSVKLRDETTLEEFANIPANGSIDWLAPWVPTYSYAPPGPTITLQLQFTRASHAFARTDVSEAPLAPPAGSPPQPVELPPVTGDVLPIGPYSIRMYSLTLQNPLPYFVGSFPLKDLDTGEMTFASAGVNDLKTWFEPPKPVMLHISSSRWDHVLRICHPDGPSYPIQRERIAGSASASVDNNEVYELSYYYFDAHSEALEEKPWYIEDVTAGEVLAPEPGSLSPTRDAQIMWIHVEPATNLVATTEPAEGIRLTWTSNGNSTDGGYLIQRSDGTNGPWQHVVRVPGDLLAFTDTAVLPVKRYHYRVRAFFGLSVAAPTNVAHAISGGSNTGVLAEDSDRDGLTNGQELALGTDPYHPDSDGDGFWDSADFAPLDGNVQLAPHNPSDTSTLTLTIYKP